MPTVWVTGAGDTLYTIGRFKGGFLMRCLRFPAFYAALGIMAGLMLVQPGALHASSFTLYTNYNAWRATFISSAEKIEMPAGIHDGVQIVLPGTSGYFENMNEEIVRPGDSGTPSWVPAISQPTFLWVSDGPDPSSFVPALSLSFYFPHWTNAFGFNYSTLDGSGFIGFTSDTPFHKFEGTPDGIYRFGNGDSGYGLDLLTGFFQGPAALEIYNIQSSPVPEPSTLILMISGLGLIAWFGKKRWVSCN